MSLVADLNEKICNKSTHSHPPKENTLKNCSKNHWCKRTFSKQMLYDGTVTIITYIYNLRGKPEHRVILQMHVVI